MLWEKWESRRKTRGIFLAIVVFPREGRDFSPGEVG
jgi:hypothetical protein